MPIVALVAVLLVFASYQQYRWESRKAVKASLDLTASYQELIAKVQSLEGLVLTSPHIDLERKTQERLNDLGEAVFTRLKAQDEAQTLFMRDIEHKLSSKQIQGPTFGR